MNFCSKSGLPRDFQNGPLRSGCALSGSRRESSSYSAIDRERSGLRPTRVAVYVQHLWALIALRVGSAVWIPLCVWPQTGAAFRR